jgi:hypothetical protein
VASRNADIKLLVGATIGVLMAGFLIAGGILVATRGSQSLVCPELNTGSAAEIRRTLQNGGPTFQSSGGASCSFYFALVDNDIVAYRNRQPQGCTLRLQRDHWECDGETVEEVDLAQYPVSIRRVGEIDSVFVDLRPPGTTSTT